MSLAASLASAAPVQWTDATGAEVKLPRAAARTVTAPMPASAVYTSVRQGVQGLEGMHASAHNNLPTTLLPSIFPGIRDVRSDITRGSSFTPNVETLLEIAPDLVWQWGHMGEDLLTPIRAAGLKVAALRYGREEDTQAWIAQFATSLGQPERGQHINAWRRAVREQLAQQTAAIAPAQRQKVLYLTRYRTGIAAAGRTGNFHTDAQFAGGINANGSQAASPNVNIEQLMVWDPDLIVLTNFEHDLTPETLYRNPMLSGLRAVQKKRIYKVPSGGYYWDPPSQDSPLYWMWLAKLMYPETVQIDLRAEMQKAFRLLYGHDITPAQIDRALHWEANRRSLHYTTAFGAPGSAPTR